MYFLLKTLESLTVHHAWIFLLLLVFTLLFIASTRSRPDDVSIEPDTTLQAIIAFMFGSLSIERLMWIALNVAQIYRAEIWFIEILRMVSHFSSLALELSLYALAYSLLGEPLKKWLKNKIQRW